MILEEIRSKTREAHQRLEETSALSKINQTSFSIEEYKMILKKFYGFISPIEKKIIDINKLATYLPDISSRYKLNLLKKDLDILLDKNDFKEIKECPELPEITNLGSAFGYLYVMEGSTLGGKVISERLYKNLNIGIGNGGAYFNNYCEDRGIMWKNFIKQLNNYSETVGENHFIVSTAVQTFEKLERWINQQ